MNKDVKFDFNDIALQPTSSTNIRSRSLINDRLDIYDGSYLPLIAAPMLSNFSKKFNPEFREQLQNLGVLTCLPRGYDPFENHYQPSFRVNEFMSISLEEFEDICNSKKTLIDSPNKILVDIANGHLRILVELVKIFKSKYPNTILMVGNVANKYTYRNLALAGADYIRCSVGTGSVCLTSVQTAVNYPLASLIDEIYKIKLTLPVDKRAYIVADGGFSNYSDIIKALNLGADFVMIGSLLNKSIDSDSIPFLWKKIPIKSQAFANWLFKHKFKLYHKYFGMSTKLAQKELGSKKLKTSEGVIKWNRVEYRLMGWLENFSDYLKSSMSYCDSNNLESFIGAQDHIFITKNSFDRFNK